MSAATAPLQYAPEVRGQYEDYPYPLRDPTREGEHFYWCDATSLVGLSHYGWGGKRDLRKGGTRILTAGCGTGDVAIMYAEELLGCDAEIVAIDLSQASLAIAKERLARRGLSQVTFHHMSLLDLPKAGLGTFDIIECSGVLHHLSDPKAGLAALTSMLKDDGMMCLMVYAQYGRMSIYMVQELMRRLVSGDMARDQKIALTREFLRHVPTRHWLAVNAPNNDMFKADISLPDGSGIYDLFLHSHDRAYTVPQLYEWVESCGLQICALYDTMVDGSLYQPETYSASPDILNRCAGMPLREQQAIAELLSSSIAKHSLNVAFSPKEHARFAEDMVPCLGAMQSHFDAYLKEYAKYARTAPLGNRIDGRITSFTVQPDLCVVNTRHTADLMEAIDGVRSIGDIVAHVAKISGSPAAEVRRNFEQLYRELRSRQVIFLRHESIPPYRSGPEIKSALDQRMGRRR